MKDTVSACPCNNWQYLSLLLVRHGGMELDQLQSWGSSCGTHQWVISVITLLADWSSNARRGEPFCWSCGNKCYYEHGVVFSLEVKALTRDADGLGLIPHTFQVPSAVLSLVHCQKQCKSFFTHKSKLCYEILILSNKIAIFTTKIISKSDFSIMLFGSWNDQILWTIA